MRHLDRPSLTKADFAEYCGISRSRLSHYIADGQLPANCLTGPGRHARVYFVEGHAALARNLDVSQVTGAMGKFKYHRE